MRENRLDDVRALYGLGPAVAKGKEP
jgi:hypothetical protein